MTGFDWRPGDVTHFIADGRRLEGVAFGPPPGSAPTIVLLHEGLGCVALWRNFPKDLAQLTGMGVFAWSRAGYGQSDPVSLPRPLEYMTREAEFALPAVLESIGFQYGILLGHSDGASIAGIYAGSVEDFRVRGLILMAPHFFTEPAGLAAISDAKAQFEQTDLRSRLAKYHRHVDNAFRGWNDAWLDPSFASWNIADVIDYWRVPVLAIQGGDDQYGSLAQIKEIEDRCYAPAEALIIPFCRHAPHLEQPAIVLNTIAEFCARLVRIEQAAVQLG